MILTKAISDLLLTWNFPNYQKYYYYLRRFDIGTDIWISCTMKLVFKSSPEYPDQYITNAEVKEIDEKIISLKQRRNRLLITYIRSQDS